MFVDQAAESQAPSSRADEYGPRPVPIDILDDIAQTHVVECQDAMRPGRGRSRARLFYRTDAALVAVAEQLSASQAYDGE